MEIIRLRSLLLLVNFSMDIVVLTLVALFILGIFLIFRMFWLWYWKIDKVVDLLESIDKTLK